MTKETKKFTLIKVADGELTQERITPVAPYVVGSFRQQSFHDQNQYNIINSKRRPSHLRFIFLSMIYFVFKFPDSRINFEDKKAFKEYNREISPIVSDDSIASVGKRSIEPQLFKKEGNLLKLDIDSKNWLIKNPNSNFEAFLSSLNVSDSLDKKVEKRKLFSLWNEYGSQIQEAITEIASKKGLLIVEFSSENNNENSLENNNNNENSLPDKMNINYLLHPEPPSINNNENTSSYKMNRNFLFHHSNSSTNLNTNRSKNNNNYSLNNENSPLQKRKCPFIDEENDRDNPMKSTPYFSN